MSRLAGFSAVLDANLLRTAYGEIAKRLAKPVVWLQNTVNRSLTLFWLKCGNRKDQFKGGEVERHPFRVQRMND